MATSVQPETLAYQDTDTLAVAHKFVRTLASDEYYSLHTGPAAWQERFAAPARSDAAPVPGLDEKQVDTLDEDRMEVADELRARGLGKKAIRYEKCCRIAHPMNCEKEPFKHRYFERFRCGLRFCRICAPFERKRLRAKYLPVVLGVIAERSCMLSEFVLARVTFTIRSNGEVPSPKQARLLNECVKRTMRSVLGKRKFGLLFRDEFGFELRGHTAERAAEGLNIHLHGLYLGPFLPWELVRDTWMRETERAFGEPSRGFYISMMPGWRDDPEQAAVHSLNHMLKYLSKPPAVSPERIADLEKAVHGVREVHALGLFYGVKIAKEKCGSHSCPACKAEGVEAYLAGEVRATPRGMMPVYRSVVELEAAGYMELPSGMAGQEEQSPEPDFPWVGESPP